jgi:hypothetical protein
MKRETTGIFATIANHAKVDDAIRDQHALDTAGICNAIGREIDGSVSVCVLAWDAEKALGVLGVKVDGQKTA